VPKLAKLAKSSGVDGVVASVQEAKAIRKVCGRDFLIVTPGVRPKEKGAAQKTTTKRGRLLQPRPFGPVQIISSSEDNSGRRKIRARAAQAIVDEIAAASNSLHLRKFAKVDRNQI